MKKSKKETIEISSISMMTDVPHTIPQEPIYLNRFSVIALNENNNNLEIISKQFSGFKIADENSVLPLLEITLEVNEGLVFDILNAGMNTKSIIITYEDRKRNGILSTEFTTIYRNCTGIEGYYGDTGIMRIKLYYRIGSQILIEGDNKLRLR